jgi:acyl-[acyl-carrier-protein]-phospholipid O-acyltransferase/long-chain-fatty-acid--[acyl-carrier-protein] ligase
VLPLRFIRRARKHWSNFAMADSTGRELTYGRTLVGSLLLAKWLRKERRDEAMLGVLFPSSVGGALANVGISLAGKVSVNLNFTAGPEAMASAIRQCGIKTVLTSRTFISKAKLEAPAGSVFIEDLLPKFSAFDKLSALLAARCLPARLLLGNRRVTPDSTATVIFSSGSTGTPKGVMLTHFNVLSNIEAMAQVFSISEKDCIVGVLPFFHSFGFTVTVWFPLVSGCSVVYHPNPTDA